jgi:hypothetical protein
MGLAKRYPIKKFTLNVKMHCCYSPKPYKRCNNAATIIKAFDIGEGKTVLAYCGSCFKDYQVRQRECRKMGID